jgi:hypothetical protein
VGGGILAGVVVYAVAVSLMRIPEVRQIRSLLPGRLRG